MHKQSSSYVDILTILLLELFSPIKKEFNIILIFIKPLKNIVCRIREAAMLEEDDVKDKRKNQL